MWDELLVGFLGGTPEGIPDVYRDSSPVTWVDAATAPFLLIYGKQDVTQPIAHSRQMVDALQVAGVEVVYAELAGVVHFAFSNWSVIGPLMLAFLERHLHPERSASPFALPTIHPITTAVRESSRTAVSLVPRVT